MEPLSVAACSGALVPNEGDAIFAGAICFVHPGAAFGAGLMILGPLKSQDEII